MFNTTYTEPVFLKHIATYRMPQVTGWYKIDHVGFEVFTAMVMKSIIFWDMTLLKINSVYE
jgi:hypothetical protein